MSLFSACAQLLDENATHPEVRPAPPPDHVPTTEMVAAGKRRIELKLLLITATGDEPEYQSARSALDRIGAPYDTLVATTTELTPALLSNNVDRCYYRGIIVAIGGLTYFDDMQKTRISAFTSTEWSALADYERACSAREVIWFGGPVPELGLAMADIFDDSSKVSARLTQSGASVFSTVQPNAVTPIRQAHGYKATVIDPTTTTTLVESADGYALLARHVASDGRETLISTVSSRPFLLHGLVFEYGLINWASRGLFLGKKRAYLTPQVDDILLGNDMWNVVTHRNDPKLDGKNIFRITGTDIDGLIAWQSELRATLPAGSAYISVMAFNGLGSEPAVYPDQTLLSAGRAAGVNLAWLNHTWDHDNMDAMTRSDAKNEVFQNCDLAKSLRLCGFSCKELVTPGMSGMTNLQAAQGLLDAGVNSVVSDASITAELAAARGTTPGDNPTFNVGRVSALDAHLYQVPRHPTNIYYDVSTRAAEVDEYNTIYRSYWKRDLSYDEIIEADTANGLQYLLSGDVDPIMFHQANLRRELVGSVGHSLFGDWIQSVATRFTALINLPILTLSQSEISRAMQARGALNACGAQATYIESAAGQTLELRSTGSCSVPVTGLSSAAGNVEVYGGAPTTEVAMTGGSIKTLNLP